MAYFMQRLLQLSLDCAENGNKHFRTVKPENSLLLTFRRLKDSATDLVNKVRLEKLGCLCL